ncbi:MAG: DNA polymerase III subunit gamma/tau [Candidatus Omnitrophica bacterium]|nr:DNA polymerase III subunit gamma/tau [Candidatus Omnitrophota bacterium]
MSYLIFARKFRPQHFDDVVGQEPIMTTLKNSIEQERVSQNFIFSGPRGVGKTTTARILAKALNCAKGPTVSPCGKCTACMEITQGNSLDVLEIDGASNRGIDEIRNLRETVKFKPVSGRLKIYIIDEVHMLTPEAFNALLTTLEEPPPHVKFIFATTELHKVPATILSRCQRFSFKRIKTQEIAKKLEEIAKKEKISCEKAALFLMAKAGDGSLRDAEGLLDQMASFAEEKIKEEDVLAALGLAAESLYFEVLTAIREKDVQKLFEITDGLYDQGRDMAQFAAGLLEFFRNLLLFQCAQKPEAFIDMSEEALGELKKHKSDFTRGELLLATTFLNQLQNQIRRALTSPKMLVEIVLLKLVHLEGLRSVEELIAPPGRGGIGPGKEKNLKDAGFQRESEPIGISQASPSASSNSNSKPQAPNPGQQSSVSSSWPQIIEYVKTKRMSTGIFLSEAEPVEAGAGVATLGLPSEFAFHKDMLEKEVNRRLVEEAFETVLGQKWRISFVVTQTERSETPVSAPAPEEAKVSEIITQALNIFEGAKIIRKES